MQLVVICFQISIFEPLETTAYRPTSIAHALWFAFKLVSLNHWKQLKMVLIMKFLVVICFQISIFEPLETTFRFNNNNLYLLWFAFKLVSLNHWKQLLIYISWRVIVVICFQISIFEPLETTLNQLAQITFMLWFAFKLVSLNHWKQLDDLLANTLLGCDLLSN